MDDADPRKEIDAFTSLLVGQLGEEIQSAARSLISLEPDVARAQLRVLRERTLRRIEQLDFELPSDLAIVQANGLTAEEVMKVYRIVLAVVEEMFERLREEIRDVDDALDGTKDDDAPDTPHPDDDKP